MKPIALALLATLPLALAGCGAPEESSHAAAANDDPRAVTPGDLPDPQPSSLCASGKEWTLSLDASGLDAWNGRAIWVSAVEPAQDDVSTVHTVAARLEATISYGEASVSCVKGLTTNMWYPSAAIVVDADGDGACSAGDVQQSIQYYGWNSDLLYTINGDSFSEESFEIGTFWTPVSDTPATWDGAAFCSYYGL